MTETNSFYTKRILIKANTRRTIQTTGTSQSLLGSIVQLSNDGVLLDNENDANGNDSITSSNIKLNLEQAVYGLNHTLNNVKVINSIHDVNCFIIKEEEKENQESSLKSF